MDKPADHHTKSHKRDRQRLRTENLRHTEEARAAQQRPCGRPRAPRTDLFATCVMIESFRRLALWLAQQTKPSVPKARFRALMVREQVPVALWDKIHLAIGRHRHCLDASGLTAMQARGLAMLTRYLEGKPRDKWDQKDRQRDGKREQLMAMHYGPGVIRRINSSIPGGTSAWRGGKLSPKPKTPEMMRGPWGAFDRWGAERHNNITMKTFRNRRAAFLQSDDLLAALLQPTPAAQRRPKKPQNQPH
jgi:hypothetical protein